MTSPVNNTPITYQPAYEVPEEGENETRDQLTATLRSIAETVYQDSGHAMRSVHAKSHGFLVGELRVLDGLPATLAQGIFAKPASYPVVMRFSTPPGDVLDDSVSTPRGLAVKVIGVAGERLPGSEGAVTQDFVMVNGPAFNAPNAKKFLGSLKLLAATTDKAPGLKKALSALFRGTEKAVEALGGQSATLLALGGQPETHILGDSFFTQAPLLFGPYMGKVSVAPISPQLTALTKAPLNVNGKPNGLRDAVVDFFSQGGGEWEVRVQLCTDLEKMPIENSSVRWPEDQSPYMAVARITVKPQQAWSEQRVAAVDDGMAFSPWHGIAAHRPIGSIMRVRKMAYEMSSAFRASNNGVKISEPANLDQFPG